MKRIIVTAVALIMISATAAAQQSPIAILEFYDDEFELVITDANGFDVSFYIGMGLSPGDQVVTGDTSAELRLDPNGSIIRIAPETTFTVGSFQGRDNAPETSFAVDRGRMRMVAARITGRDSRYSIVTPTAVAGVRGTDFGVSVVGEGAGVLPSEELFVFEGEVVFSSFVSGEEISVTAGQFADAFAETFLPQVMTPEQLQLRREGLDFQALDPADVPGAPEPVEEEPIQDVEPAVVDPVPSPGAAEPGAGDELFGRIASFTGLQVGSVTINEETWAKVVFQPRLSIGRLALELYLPITYRENLFDTGDWYRPEDNDEWSFGTDQDWSEEPEEGLRDLGTDLALKIRSIEYGEHGDRFFFKVGNLSNFTVGQGLLMRNYANDIDFPAVRNVGFNLGADFGGVGIEAVVNDLTEPEIYGGRLFFRPDGSRTPVAVGLSGIADVNPTGEISATGGAELGVGVDEIYTAAEDSDLYFLNVGADIEFTVIDRERLGIIGFAEIGSMLPYVREGTTLFGEEIDSGLRDDAVFDSWALNNYGWNTGVRGRVALLDYRLEFRSFDGIFRPGFYGPTYDRIRGQRAAEVITYLSDPENEEFDVLTMGVAGEAGASLFEVLYLSAGYFWPWEVDDGSWRGSNEDEFLFSVTAQEGLIPFGIQAGFEYRRTHFAATIAGWGEYSEATLFDANTTLDAFVAYPFNEFVSLVARVSTAAQRDSEGEIIYDSDGNPRMAPTVVIQTQIGF